MVEKKMFEKILVIAKNEQEKEYVLKSKIKEYLGNREIEVIEVANIRKDFINTFDLIITFGGDGTFVKTANLIENCFILGINSRPESSEGALTTINVGELEKLKQVFEKDFEVLTRERIKVKLNGNVLDEHSLNEVYIGALSQFHTSRYRINFKDKEEEHRSSGIIVSTGTGSPAWFYSAGGEVLNHDERKLKFIVREPYHGKRIYKPEILNGEIKEGEKLIVKSEKDFGGVVAINDTLYDFNKGDVVDIGLSDKPLKAIKIKW
jgi:NAD kinase